MKRLAFTLVELLTVLAIIAILAAIIFPVYARAKDSANRNGDLTAMNELRVALQLYKVDNGGYPPALLGYVGRYTSGPNTGQVIPANLITGFLFPKRVTSLARFKPVPLRSAESEITNAVWPNQDPRPLGTAGQVDINANGIVDGTDDIQGARQAYGPTNLVYTNPRLPGGSGNPAVDFYRISGYDTAEVPDPSLGKRQELRYALFWSNFAVGQGAGFGSGSASDDPRQLGYSDPPDNTVITWNSYYREWSNGQLPRSKRDMVLFVGGSARPYDSVDLYDRSWRVLP